MALSTRSDRVRAARKHPPQTKTNAFDARRNFANSLVTTNNFRAKKRADYHTGMRAIFIATQPLPEGRNQYWRLFTTVDGAI